MLTYSLSNIDAVAANFLSRDRRVQKEMRDLVSETAEDAAELAFQLCPKDTHYMSEHIRTDISAGGFRWAIGWQAEDFVGVPNPVTGRLMIFYPPLVDQGSFLSAAQPTLGPTMAAMSPEFSLGVSDIMRRGFLRQGAT